MVKLYAYIQTLFVLIKPKIINKNQWLLYQKNDWPLSGFLQSINDVKNVHWHNIILYSFFMNNIYEKCFKSFSLALIIVIVIVLNL